ncbi:hypothetical protein C2845_PM08G08470 [Panicum miliaceum]|uniref:Cysteine proteinase inhibitor n=1 Tax=Panicum miliaceum TaxID=4540 RepID=A0A3L6R064_PANMI|nr:hypothetical protein C2845_PM08G08470 [Panicum miliaceum]
MERKFYEKYTSLKKRKLLDEGLERKREQELKELYDAMKDWVRGLEKDKEELSEKLADKEDDLEKVRQDFLADIQTRDSEILRLKQLLDEKTEKNNSTARSVDQTPEVIHENPTRMSPRRKTPQSNIRAKRVQLSENTAIPHSSLEEESQENVLLEFVRVVEAKEQVVAGTMHHLTLEAIEAGRKKVYEAKVWVKPWLDFKELQQFVHKGTPPPSPTPTSAPRKLVGVELHRFQTMEELVDSVTEAYDGKRWLEAEEVSAMMLNPARFLWHGSFDDRLIYRDCFFILAPRNRLGEIAQQSGSENHKRFMYAPLPDTREDKMCGIKKNKMRNRMANDSNNIPLTRYEVKGAQKRRRYILPDDFEEMAGPNIARPVPDLVVLQYQLVPQAAKNIRVAEAERRSQEIELEILHGHRQPQPGPPIDAVPLAWAPPPPGRGRGGGGDGAGRGGSNDGGGDDEAVLAMPLACDPRLDIGGPVVEFVCLGRVGRGGEGVPLPPVHGRGHGRAGADAGPVAPPVGRGPGARGAAPVLPAGRGAGGRGRAAARGRWHR